MSNETEYYDILGLKKSDNPDPPTIKKAYRKMARKYHPDRCKEPDAEQKMQAITQAYGVLSDEEKKELYDKWGKEGVQKGGNPNMGRGGIFDFFNPFDRRGEEEVAKKRKQKGQSVRQGMRVTLEEMYNGVTKKVRVTRTRLCAPCQGSGATDPTKVNKCTKCKGSGFVTAYQQIAPGFVSQSRRHCDECRGVGEKTDPKFVCKECKGDKIVTERKTLEINIEQGMRDGQKIVFDGEADERPGITPGDVIFQLQLVPHKTFKREGSHLKMRQKIDLASALTGATFKVNHLDKRILVVTSKEGEVLRPGLVKQITDEGMPTYRRPFDKGNLFIEFEIEFPSKIPPKIASGLMKLLPKKTAVANKGKLEEAYLTEPDFSSSSRHYGNAYDSDDEQESREGISCAAQ